MSTLNRIVNILKGQGYFGLEDDEQDSQDSIVIKKAVVVLTDAQIKALPTTAIQIIDAPGENKIIIPLQAILYFNWTADYANIDGLASAIIAWDDLGAESPFKQVTDVASLLASGASANIILGLDDPASRPDGFNINLPLFINIVNSLGNLTSGNAANTLTVNVLYSIIDLD